MAGLLPIGSVACILTYDWFTPKNQGHSTSTTFYILKYIALCSPRDLKPNDRDRALILYALRKTTNPSALTLVKRMLRYLTLPGISWY